GGDNDFLLAIPVEVAPRGNIKTRPRIRFSRQDVDVSGFRRLQRNALWKVRSTENDGQSSGQLNRFPARQAGREEYVVEAVPIDITDARDPLVAWFETERLAR